MFLLLGIAALALVGDVQGTVVAHINARVAEERSRIVLELNEHSLARFATHRVAQDSLRLALEAADQLNGTLVAALAIRTRPDTVFVPRAPVETTRDTLGTRYATLSDTTDMGITVTVEATAPPDPAPLQLGMQVIVPEFRPEIAFVENTEGVFATVSWANQRFQVEAPFFRPQQVREKPLRLNLGARVLLGTPTAVSSPIYGAAYAALSYRTQSGLEFQVPFGIHNQGLYSGIEVERTIRSWNGLLDLLIPF